MPPTKKPAVPRSLPADALEEHRARLTALRDRLTAEIGTAPVAYVAGLARQLQAVLTALNEQRVRSVSAGDQQNRSEIRAPYTGIVEKIAFAAIGEVVRPAEPIMEIVPDSDEMVVEVGINPSDVDQVQKGQLARVRFSSFNRAATPEIDGKVVYVATDRSDNPESKQSFYTVRITVNQTELRKEGLNLRSGMPAEVQIHTGNRPMLSYITKPLRDQFARAFRDN